MALEVIDSGTNSPMINMMRDEKLLDGLSYAPRPIFHTYDWEAPSATYGYFNHPLQSLNPKAISQFGLQLAKRPTGGGVIFHQFDLAFSFLLPTCHALFSLNTLANYQLINAIVAEVVTQFLPTPPALAQQEVQSQKSPLQGFCMAALTIYDVSVAGRKVAGAAQRKTKQGLLHQSSICLTLPPDAFLENIFLPHTPFAEAMRTKSHPILTTPSPRLFLETKKHLLSQLIAAFQRRFF